MTLGLKVGTSTSVSDTSSACKVFRLQICCQNKITIIFTGFGWKVCLICMNILILQLCTDLWVLDTGSGSRINHALSFCFQVTAVTWLSDTVSCQQRIIALDTVCFCLWRLGGMLPQLISWACGCHMVILYPAAWQCAIVETGQTSLWVTICQHWHGVAGLKRPDGWICKRNGCRIITVALSKYLSFNCWNCHSPKWGQHFPH